MEACCLGVWDAHCNLLIMSPMAFCHVSSSLKSITQDQRDLLSGAVLGIEGKSGCPPC